MELAVEQIRMPDVTLTRPGGAGPLRTVLATDIELAHQPGDRITTNIEASPSGCLPPIPRAIRPEVVLPQLQQHRPEHGVVLGSHGRRTGLGGVVGRWGDQQFPADRLDLVDVLLGVDVVDYQRNGRLSSAMKKVADERRIEVVRRS